MSCNRSNLMNKDAIKDVRPEVRQKMNTVIAVPILHGTYTNKTDAKSVEFLHRTMRSFHCIFLNLCHNCNAMEGTTVKTTKNSVIIDGPEGGTGIIQRCGGCQLVAYCSKACQKADWSTHKYVCKEFPVVNGRNVLHTTGNFDDRLNELSKRAEKLPNYKVSTLSLFRFPRVCFTCKESRPTKLTDCECSTATYCSKKCADADKAHKEECERKFSVKRSYFFCSLSEPPSLRDVSVCEKFTPIISWSDIIVSPLLEVYNDEPKMPYVLNRLSYPISLLYTLQSLPERRLGINNIPLEELTSLKVHALISTPLFDSEPWEIFMHRLPKLKRLKVVFVRQQRSATLMRNLNHSIRLKRCKNCEANDRVITYALKQMQYHMYFSSSVYSTPDVVIIYGNAAEMAPVDDDDIHQELSWSNMTYSPHTVLILTEGSKDLIKKGIGSVNAARPIEQLVSPQMNPFFGFSKDHKLNLHLNSDEQIKQIKVDKIMNDKFYFTCLRKKL